MLTVKSRPCWHLDDTSPGDPYLGGPHFGSRTAADLERDAAGDLRPSLTVRTLDAPCTVIVCDGCGVEAEDPDTFAVMHFPDDECARSMAAAHDFTIDADGRVWCGQCQWARRAAGVPEEVRDRAEVPA